MYGKLHQIRIQKNAYTTQTAISKTCFSSTVRNRAQHAINCKWNSVPVQILILCPALRFVRIIYADLSCHNITFHALSCRVCAWADRTGFHKGLLACPRLFSQELTGAVTTR